jgi:uncharacterized protein YbjT (DUF2867 family)
MSTSDAVLVTGITGQQGGAAADSLLRRGVRVVGLTRDAGKAAEWKSRGVELAEGNLSDAKSMEGALKKAGRVFLVTTFVEEGMDAEVRQGTTAIDAAKASGVKHLVFASVVSAEKRTGIPHFETKGRIEEHLRRSGVPFTILRPVFFMENFASPWMLPAIRQGKLVNPVRPSVALQMIALRDIGEFVAAAFGRPKEFLGQAVELAGDELTMPEAMRILSERMGRKIAYEVLPDDQLENAVGHDMATMYRWFNSTGYHVDIPALAKRWGIPLTRFSELVREARWASAG